MQTKEYFIGRHYGIRCIIVGQPCQRQYYKLFDNMFTELMFNSFVTSSIQTKVKKWSHNLPNPSPFLCIFMYMQAACQERQDLHCMTIALHITYS